MTKFNAELFATVCANFVSFGKSASDKEAKFSHEFAVPAFFGLMGGELTSIDEIVTKLCTTDIALPGGKKAKAGKVKKDGTGILTSLPGAVTRAVSVVKRAWNNWANDGVKAAVLGYCGAMNEAQEAEYAAIVAELGENASERVKAIALAEYLDAIYGLARPKTFAALNTAVGKAIAAKAKGDKAEDETDASDNGDNGDNGESQPTEESQPRTVSDILREAADVLALLNADEVTAHGDDIFALLTAIGEAQAREADAAKAA